MQKVTALLDIIHYPSWYLKTIGNTKNTEIYYKNNVQLKYTNQDIYTAITTHKL